MAEKHLQATISARGVIRAPNGQILILKRAADGQWELPGGRLTPREAPIQGLRREIAEETTLTIDVIDILAANSWINDANEGRFAVHYECVASNPDVELSREHTDCRWIEETAARTLLCESQRTAIHAATGSPEARASSADQPSEPSE